MKRHEFGRSMIEMIGVLAIIGVISIGGVWGLNKALTKNTTNNLIEDVKLAGFVVVSELFDTLPDVDEETGLNLAGKFAQNTPYTFKAFPEGETTFEIFVPDVSYNVCMELKQRKVDWLEEIKANGIPNVCNKNTPNEMSFFFNTLLNGNTEQQTLECRTNKDCPSAKPYCRNGICSKCENGILHNGRCVECSQSPFYSGVSTQNCHLCGNDYFSNERDGGCYKCSIKYGDAQYASREECARCPNRCWDEQQQKCLHSEDDLFNQDGTCNWSCSTGMYASSNVSGVGDYRCLECPALNGFQFQRLTTADICHTCGQNYLFSTWKWCLGCQSGYRAAEESSLEECKRCSNRYFNETDQKCYLCPAGKKASADGLSCIDL